LARARHIYIYIYRQDATLRALAAEGDEAREEVLRLQEALSSATRALERAERRMGEEVERGGRLERELAGAWGTLAALKAAKGGEGDAHAAMDMEVQGCLTHKKQPPLRTIL